MRMLVLFPKQQCYSLKDLSTQRSLDERFSKYLKILKDCSVKVEVLLEDQLAYEMLNKNGITPDRIITCLAPSDFDWISRYPDIENFSQRILADYSSTTQVIYDAESKYVVPITLMKEGKMSYYKARVDAYHKKYRYALNRYVAESKNIFQFLAAANLNRCTPISETFRQGDGRLCAEVNLSNGTTNIYYGGVRVMEEHLPTILSM